MHKKNIKVGDKVIWKGQKVKVIHIPVFGPWIVIEAEDGEHWAVVARIRRIEEGAC